MNTFKRINRFMWLFLSSGRRMWDVTRQEYSGWVFAGADTKMELNIFYEEVTKAQYRAARRCVGIKSAKKRQRDEKGKFL